MAKFCNSHLKLNSNERIYFGDLDNASFTYDGSDLVVDVPIRGEKAVQPYHLVRYDQFQDLEYSLNQSDWQESILTISGSPPGSPSDGDRYLVDTGATGAWSGLDDYIVTWDANSATWSGVMPSEGMTTFIEDNAFDKYYLYYNGAWAPMGEGIDHGDLKGLGDDDHPQYILVDGSRGFTSTVSGVYPVVDSDLATKEYVDDAVAGATPTGFVTISGNETITGDKIFDGTLTTFLNDVFFDGINITMSGTTLTTEANAVFNYDSTATINNAGDNNYQSGATITFENGSTVTFSGSTNFESDINFGSTTTSGLTLDFKDNTISGTGDIYAGNLYVDNIVNECEKWGRTAVISGAVSQAVTFDTPFPDDDYTLVATLTNEVDSPPCIYSTIQGVKTASGFTTHFSGDIENGNFILEWHAKCGQQS